MSSLARIKAVLGSKSFLLVFSLFIIYHINFQSNTGTTDTFPALLLPISILSKFNVNLDEFTFLVRDGLPYYLTHSNGHLYSNYSLIPSIMAVPVYIIPALAGKVSVGVNLIIYAKLAASLMAAISALFVYLSLIRLRAGERFAIFLAFSYALATGTWTTSSQSLWEHTSGEFFMAMMLFTVLSIGANKRYMLFCGGACALAVASRLNNLIMVLPVTLYILIKYKKESWQFFILPMIIGTWFFMMNFLHFGTLLGGAGELMKQPPMRQGIEGGMTGSFFEGFIGILFSPSRGLLIFSPWLIFSFAGMVAVWTRSKEPLFKYISVGAVVTVLFFGQFSTWWGGLCYGPRYLVDFLPFLAIFPYFLKDVLIKYRPLATAFALLIIFSLAVQIIGAFNYSTDWYNNPTNVDFDHKRLWDWKDSEITRAIKNGPGKAHFIDYLFSRKPKK